MIYEENYDYTIYCTHDPDRICCISCQENAAKYFVYHNIPRRKWPMYLQNKFLDLTKDQIEKELELYRKSPERTNSLLQKILNKLQDLPFIS